MSYMYFVLWYVNARLIVDHNNVLAERMDLTALPLVIFVKASLALIIQVMMCIVIVTEAKRMTTRTNSMYISIALHFSTTLYCN